MRDFENKIKLASKLVAPRAGIAPRLHATGAGRRPDRRRRQYDVRARRARRAQEGRHLQDRHRPWRHHRYARPGDLDQRFPVRHVDRRIRRATDPDRPEDRAFSRISPRASSPPTVPPSGSSSCARARPSTMARTSTANDVVETYNYHRGENSKSAVKSALDIVADIKADGKETVIFTLKSGSADFPYITSDYHLPIYPAKDGGGIEWEKGISAGPFMLENYRAGRQGHGQAQSELLRRGQALFRRCRDACRSSM